MYYYNGEVYSNPSGDDFDSMNSYNTYSYSTSSSVSGVDVLVPVLVGVGALLVLVVCVTLCTACCACCRTKSRGRILAQLRRIIVRAPPTTDATVAQAPRSLPSHPYHVIPYPVPETQFSSATAAHPPPYAPPAPYLEGVAPCHSAAPGVLCVADPETFKLLE